MQLGNEEKGVGLQVMANGEMYLSVANPAWTFETQKSFPTKYAIDNAPSWEGDAVAVTPNIVVISLPVSSDPVARLANGKSFVATVGSTGPLTFDLSGAPAARNVLKACMAKKNGF